MSLQEGLVGHWTMDNRDTSNNIISDSSAYNNNIDVLNSNVDLNIPSIRGEGCRSIESNSQVLQINYSDKSVLQQQEFTIHAVAKFIKDSSYSPIIMHGEPLNRNNSGYTLRIEEDEAEAEIITDSGREDVDISIDTTQWIPITVTYDGTNLKLYSGNSFSEKTISSDIVYNTGRGTDNFTVGGFSYTDLSRKVEISDLRFYNRALLESEINQLYQMRSQQVRQA